MDKFICDYCGKFVFRAYVLGKEKICEGFVGKKDPVYKGRALLHNCKEDKNELDR